MRLWILFGCGVVVVAAAIWPSGQRTQQLGTVPVGPAVVQAPPVPAPKPAPAQVVEVIDLARAYEPVREPEEPAGTVNPASFIQVPEGPQRIPPAIDLESTKIGESPTGVYIFGVFVPGPERIGVMPRDVTRIEAIRQFQERRHMFETPPGGWVIGNEWPLGEPDVIPSAAPPVERLKVMPRVLYGGLLNFVPTPTDPTGGFSFTPMSVPYDIDITQPIPPNASIQNGLLNFTPSAPVEALKVMPRLVPARFVVAQADGRLLH